MDNVYLYLDDWANCLRKLGPEFVFSHACFREAAERYSATEVAELHRQFREVAPVPEDYWRAEFARVFVRSGNVLPSPDWEAYQQFYGPGVFYTINDGDVEALRWQDGSFRKLGFRIVDVRLTTSFRTETEQDVAAVWFPPGRAVPEVWSPLAFAEWRERPEVVALLRGLSIASGEPRAAPDPAA